MVRFRAVVLFVALAGLVVLPNGRASLHHPDEPMAVPVNAQGVPEPLPFDAFSRRRAELTNMLNPDRALTNPNNPGEKSERGRLADRIAKARQNPNRTPEQSVALAVDLLRFGRPDEATGALRGQRGGFLPNVTLAHVAAAQGEWGQAFEYLDIANESAPGAVPGLTPQQLAWQVKLNRGPLARFVRLRWEEAKTGKPPVPEAQLPDAIFPIDFTNVVGPALAPAEQAKLPPDALAPAQQFVLWFPSDPRLYWLLAEVYAAKGQFAEARRIMDAVVEGFKYSNRKVLMQHREAVTKAANEKGPPAPDELLMTPEGPLVGQVPAVEPPVPFSLGAVWVYFGVVGVIALFALVRALTKKKPTSRTRIG